MATLLIAKAINFMFWSTIVIKRYKENKLSSSTHHFDW